MITTLEMNRIDQMLDSTRGILKDVDKEDIEFVSASGMEAFFYLTALNKSISMRQQINPEHETGGSIIKFKRNFDILEGIYSWCGFESLNIIISVSCSETESPITKTLNLASEIEPKVLNYNDTAPGWISIPFIFFHPFINITIQYTEKIIFSDSPILLKTIMLTEEDRNKFGGIL